MNDETTEPIPVTPFAETLPSAMKRPAGLRETAWQAARRKAAGWLLRLAARIGPAPPA